MFRRHSLLLLILALAAPALHGAEIHDAVRQKDLKRVAQLLANGREQLLAVDDSRRTPLHWAAMEKDLQLLELVFDEKALEARDFLNYTPLYLAILGDLQSVRWLLDHGAQVNVTTRLERATPLHWAAEQGKADIVALLLDRGADPQARNLAGSTALHIAAKLGREEVVRLLLERKLDPEAANLAGFTPLMFAARNGDASVVRLLIAAGAPLDAKDRRGKTAWDVANELGRTELLPLLRPGSSQ